MLIVNPADTGFDRLSAGLTRILKSKKVINGMMMLDTNRETRRMALDDENAIDEGKAVASFHDSEKRYRRLFESAKDGILILDAATGKVVDVNPFLLQLLGYSYNEIIGRHLWEIGSFQDIAASKTAFKKLQDTEYIRYDNLPLKTRDGKSVEVEFISNVYLVDQSKVIQCNIRDITGRREMEKTLQKSEAKMRSILDNIGIGVALISPKMEILELNRQMREWFPDIQPDHHPICFQVFNDPPGKEPCKNCPTQKTLKDGLVHENAVQPPRAGTVKNYRVVSSPIRDASGEITAAIEMVEDITEKLALESQVRQSQKMEAVGRLASGVAHDYNNGLTVIMGYTEQALDKINPTDPLYDDLQEVFKAASHSAAVTQQLLAFARKQHISPKVIDLNEAIGGMQKMLQRLIGEDIHLSLLSGTSLRPILMDSSQLDQILANLCINARDAIAGVGKITIETSMASFDDTYCANHAGFVPGDFVVLAVSDDGCGMSRETQGHIFEPFYTTKKLGVGTGLGLSTVYGIVNQNNGFIDFTSEPEKGTIFKIYLPCHQGEAAASQKILPAKMPAGHGETILVVDDDAAVLNLVRSCLKRLGYTVLVSDMPGEAVKMAEMHLDAIRLVITDVIMPEMNGQELVNRLMALKPDLQYLFMSGYTADVIRDRGLTETNGGFIQKPFSMKTLAAKVSEALDGNR